MGGCVGAGVCCGVLGCAGVWPRVWAGGWAGGRAGRGGAAHQREDSSEEGEVAAARARRVRDERDVDIDDERGRRPRRVQLPGEVEG